MKLRNLYLTALFAATAAFSGCGIGPSEEGSFDRNFSVSGPTRLELASGSGAVRITGSGTGKIHIHGEVRAGSFFGSAKDELQRVLDNPPIEQHANTIRIGKDFSGFRNSSISYTIEVPQETELNIKVASGSQEIRNVRGPVDIQAASG